MSFPARPAGRPAHARAAFQMPTVMINLLLPGPRIYSGEFLDAKVCLDSADPATVVSEFYAEVRGLGRTGWVNVHTDKIYETERVSAARPRTPPPRTT